MSATSAAEVTLKACPFAFLIFCIVISCSFVNLPVGVLTSKATKRPPMQAMMSGMPAVPYIPPCSFHAKQPGVFFNSRRIAATMSRSAMSVLL